MVDKTIENYRQIQKAFALFKMPLFDMTEENFLFNDKIDVYTFGRQPVAIDIMNSIKGPSFKELFDASEKHIINGIEINVIQLNHLIETKKQSGRFKDLDDIQNLTSN